MHFDLKLWRMTAGLRGRIALSACLGLLALAVGIARFAFLGRFLAGVFHGETPIAPLLGAAGAILLRAWLDHHSRRRRRNTIRRLIRQCARQPCREPRLGLPMQRAR